MPINITLERANIMAQIAEMEPPRYFVIYTNRSINEVVYGSAHEDKLDALDQYREAETEIILTEPQQVYLGNTHLDITDPFNYYDKVQLYYGEIDNEHLEKEYPEVPKERK